MRSEHLGVAIVGAGQMGSRHALAVAKTEGMSVRLVIDLERERAAEVAAAVDAEFDSDLMAWKDRNDIGAVYVCVPASLHHSVAIPALASGRHVFCEKPLALRIEDGRAIESAAKSSGGMCAINFQHRHRDPVRHLRTIFTDDHGPFYGSIVSVASVRPKPAMHDATMNGGPMIDNLCHFIDLVRFVTGANPTAVTARGTRLAEGKPEVLNVAELAVDSGVMVVEFGDRGAVQILMSWGLPKGVKGANRLILIDKDRKAEYAFPKTLEVTGSTDSTNVETVEDASDPIAAQAAAFARATATGASSAAGIEDGMWALKTGHAILESIGSGCRVPIQGNEKTGLRE